MGEGVTVDLDPSHDLQVPTEEPQEEAVPAKPIRAPDEPSDKEYQCHLIGHLPYRSWCRWCVMGKGRNLAHKKIDAAKERLLPMVIQDFGFLGQKNEKTSPVLCMDQR